MRHSTVHTSFGWGALAAVSVALLAVALIVPENLGAALAGIGLAGLFVVRLGASVPRQTPPLQSA
jgi:hypothetical protein